MIPDDAIHIALYRDGDKWCAVDANLFINIHESPIGFGETEAQAVENFLLDRQGLLNVRE